MLPTANDDLLDISDAVPAPSPIIAPAPAPSATAIVVPSDDDVRAALAQAPSDATPEAVRDALIAANGDLGGAVAALWGVSVSVPAIAAAAERTEQQKLWDGVREKAEAMNRLRNAYGVPRGGRTTI